MAGRPSAEELAAAKLKKAETVDKSGPAIDSDVKVGAHKGKELMAEISQGLPLKNQKISTDDRSSPIIDSSVVLKASPRGAVNLEAMIAVKKRSDLNHVETIDKSAPFIEKDVTVGTFKGKELIAEVAKGKSLKPTVTDDKSAPAVESDVKIKPNPRVALLNDVCKKEAAAA
mmetsp:Transcript_13434/g.42632  ORF Transcript_13434/g.42632 Transcript_13434/m.42632 type:complete len:172 (-) Transcript_13434:416-931(-)